MNRPDILANHALKRLALRISDVPQANLFRLTVQQSHHDALPAPPVSGLFDLVHVSGEAADKSTSDFFGALRP